MKGKLLFLSHDANRTGAPILLKNLMLILKDSGYSINLLVKKPEGPLMDDFRRIADNFQTIYRRPGNRLARLGMRFFGNANFNSLSSSLYGVAFVINNTITNGDVLRAVRCNTKAKIVTYVHELETACETFTTRAYINETIACSDLFLVPCASVKQFLINRFNIDTERIYELDYFIPDCDDAKCSDGDAEVNDDFIVGGCGTTDWRKGFDIFIQIANKVIKDDRKRKIQFQWKGLQWGSTSHVQAMYDVDKLGIADAVSFLESSGDMHGFFARLDLFVLPSREDPYPLVVLEAAAFKVPTVCFARAGGAGEFVEDDAGKSVNYLCVDEMTDSIISYYDNRALLRSQGERAYEKLTRKHQNAATIVDQFEKALAAA